MPPKSFVTPNFVAPRKVCFETYNNYKILPSKNVFSPFKSQNLVTGLLHFKDNWG